MIIEALHGVDQQRGSLIETTDFEVVRDMVYELARDSAETGGLNVSISRSKAADMLRHYMLIASQSRLSILDGASTLYQRIRTRYTPTQQRKTLSPLYNALQKLAVAGSVPESILRPWTYKKPDRFSLGDLGAGAGEYIDKSINKLIIAGVVLGLGYIAVTRGIPAVSKSMRR